MTSDRNSGLVQTVLGPVHPSELGATTTHEHLYIDFAFAYRPAQDSPSEELADAPITLENLGWIRRNYYSNRSNLQLTDLDTAISEVRKYRDSRWRRDCGRDQHGNPAQPGCVGPDLPGNGRSRRHGLRLLRGSGPSSRHG